MRFLKSFASFLSLLFISYTSIAQTGTSFTSQQITRDFKAMLDRPKVPFDARFTVTQTDSMVMEKGTINTEKTEKVPVIVYKPRAVAGKESMYPVVICQHGTGATKDQKDIQNFMKRFVRLGFMAVAIDARYHGERVAGGAHAKKEYEQAVIVAWKNTDKATQTHPFLYDTVFDTWRLIDYLVSRKDVDAGRIGMTGISMGGIETWMAGAVDQRIKVAVPIIAAQSFNWSLANNRWQGRAGTIQAAHDEVAKERGDAAVNQENVAALWNKVVPGITGEFDCPSMLPLFVPRPLLILSTEKDQNCPLPGAIIAYNATEAAYKAAHATDKLEMNVAPNQPHTLVPQQAEMAVAFFKKWL